jgi:hypothetical protein
LIEGNMGLEEIRSLIEELTDSEKSFCPWSFESATKKREMKWKTNRGNGCVHTAGTQLMVGSREIFAPSAV